MLLQSHDVVITDVEKWKDDGVMTVELVCGEARKTLTIANDFTTAAQNPDNISVGTLIDLMTKVLSKGFLVPETHAVAWRAIRTGAYNMKEALHFSQTQHDLETAKPKSLDIEFEFRVVEDLASKLPPKKIRVAANEFTLDSYLTFISRLQQYQHHYSVDCGVLKVNIAVMSITNTHADKLATALTTEDGGYNVAILNDNRPHYNVFIPGYLVSSADGLVDALNRRVAPELLPTPVVDDRTITLNTNKGFDELQTSVYFTLNCLESEYDAQ